MEKYRYPLIIVPGSMGSELYLDSDRLWPPDKRTDFQKLDEMVDTPLKVGDVVRVMQPMARLPFGKVDLWQSFIDDFMVGELGYTEEQNLFIFSYDWRQDIRDSARELREAVKRCSDEVREANDLESDTHIAFFLVGFRMGTSVCRWYVDQEGGEAYVAHMMLISATDRGVPSSFELLTQKAEIQVGSETGQFFSFDKVMSHLAGDLDLSDIIRNLRSTYQTLPGTQFVAGTNGPIDIFEDTSWLVSDIRPNPIMP